MFFKCKIQFCNFFQNSVSTDYVFAAKINQLPDYFCSDSSKSLSLNIFFPIPSSNISSKHFVFWFNQEDKKLTFRKHELIAERTLWLQELLNKKLWKHYFALSWKSFSCYCWNFRETSALNTKLKLQGIWKSEVLVWYNNSYNYL